MKERLRIYIEEMTRDIPKTPAVKELMEEVIGNLEERYDDLIAEGVLPEEAYQRAINSLGNVRALFEERAAEVREKGTAGAFNDRQKVQPGEEPGKKKKKTALWIAGMILFFLLIAGGVVLALGLFLFDVYEEASDGFSGYEQELEGTFDEYEEKIDAVFDRFDDDDFDDRKPREIISQEMTIREDAPFIRIAYTAADVVVTETTANKITIEEYYYVPKEEAFLTEMTEDADGGVEIKDYGATGIRPDVWDGIRKLSRNERKKLPQYAKISIPKHYTGKVEVHTVSGDINYMGYREADRKATEEYIFQSVSGDMELKSLYGNAFSLETTSGEIDVMGVSGNVLSAKTVSGDMDMENVSAKITAESTSGDIELQGIDRSAEANTVSGELSVSNIRTSPFSFRANTVSGELETNFGNALTFNRRRTEAEGVVGDGIAEGDQVEIKLNTTSGDIECYR